MHALKLGERNIFTAYTLYDTAILRDTVYLMYHHQRPSVCVSRLSIKPSRTAVLKPCPYFNRDLLSLSLDDKGQGQAIPAFIGTASDTCPICPRSRYSLPSDPSLQPRSAAPLCSPALQPIHHPHPLLSPHHHWTVEAPPPLPLHLLWAPDQAFPPRTRACLP